MKWLIAAWQWWNSLLPSPPDQPAVPPFTEDDLAELRAIVHPQFDWAKEYRGLWESVPTAFWLAPTRQQYDTEIRQLLLGVSPEVRDAASEVIEFLREDASGQPVALQVARDKVAARLLRTLRKAQQPNALRQLAYQFADLEHTRVYPLQYGRSVSHWSSLWPHVGDSHRLEFHAMMCG